MLIHWIWLNSLKTVNYRQKQMLLEHFGSPEDLFNAHTEAVDRIEGLTREQKDEVSERDLTAARKILDDCSKKRIGILTYSDAAYPQRLKNTHQPPFVLYYKGVLPDWESVPVIGVVGTRRASPYGLQSAKDLSYQITMCGGLVVSGGASGIDAAAAEGAMAAEGSTVAVLGNGVDIVYPPTHKDLFRRIAECGCLISEFAPGTRPYKWNFPQRNRIISGLSAAVLVVEAPKISGALSTANHAREQGRDVYAVPGNINAPECEGSNELLRERAIPAFSGWDVVREYATLYPDKVHRCDRRLKEEPMVAQPAAPAAKVLPDKKSVDNLPENRYSDSRPLPEGLSEDEKTVAQLLTKEPCHVDQLIDQLSMPAGKVLSTLTILTLKGVAQNHPGNCISLAERT